MKTLTTDDLKRIINRRDSRYDGRFYFGVKTTEIYCRPVCPAKPKPENIVIFKSASEAESHGYRPCLRCRPDVAPGSKFLQGTVNSVSRALRIIDETAEENMDVMTLAEKVGMTDRHLRRLFDEHLGASPIEILVTKRLHLARQLIVQTPRPITEIALAVGFKSIRRFNEAFKKLYKVPPSELRKKASASVEKNVLTLSIPVRLPFDWKLVAAYLTRHETFGVEQVSSESYTRFVPTEDGYATLEIRFDEKNRALKIKAMDLPLSKMRTTIAMLKHLFDTEHNPNHLPNGRIKTQGVRIPGCFDGYEVAVSIILGQLVSTEHAKAKVKDLVLRYGTKLNKTEEIYVFPTPKILSDAAIEELGITRIKAGAIRSLSRSVMTGEIQLSPTADPEVMRKKLLAIKGIGPWTVEMIAMRCLGDSDAFPSNDLIVERAIKNKTIKSEEWASFRAYLVHCLWRDSVQSSKKKGTL